jgi:AmiR/NasT family two-component response regulator
MDQTSGTVDVVQQALQHRTTVHRALGVLMEQRGLRPDEAEALIREKALTLAVPVEELAAEILRSCGD